MIKEDVISELRFLFTLIKRVMILLLLYAISRLYFYIINRSLFPEVNFLEYLTCQWHGMRFDICAIAYTNALFILLSMLPLPFRTHKVYRTVLKSLFYLVNIPLFMIMIGDAEYYKFSLRHGTLELASFLVDFIRLLPAYALDFWYFVPVFIAIILLVEFMYRRSEKTNENYYKRRFWIQLVLFVLAMGGTFLATRGGYQPYPLSPITAGRYVPPSQISLVVNTPFSIIYSYFHRKLSPVEYIKEEELKKYFNPYHNPAQDSLMPTDGPGRDNIIIIVMESFSADYTGIYGPKTSATPFLDSLASGGYFFPRMYANGARSVDGIPAITAGIPAHMDESFLSSIYQTNTYTGLPAYLKKLGYASSFFHGGHNGTFNLDNFAFSAGFENYYGLNEYKGAPEDKSHWGIYDKPFFDFAANKIHELDTPFVVTFFSLSSHHPYSVPQSYSESYPQLENEVLNSVQYADYSLRTFFEKIKNEPWFENTLFIITADHAGPAIAAGSDHKINRFHIPLVLYHPNHIFFRNKIDYRSVQHADILPTVLDYVEYPDSYFSFGTGLFRDNPHYAFLYTYGNELILHDGYALELFEGEPQHFYQQKNQNNFEVINSDASPELFSRLKLVSNAFIQTYTQSLIRNQMD